MLMEVMTVAHLSAEGAIREQVTVLCPVAHLQELPVHPLRLHLKMAVGASTPASKEQERAIPATRFIRR